MDQLYDEVQEGDALEVNLKNVADRPSGTMTIIGTVKAVIRDDAGVFKGMVIEAASPPEFAGKFVPLSRKFLESAGGFDKTAIN